MPQIHEYCNSNRCFVFGKWTCLQPLVFVLNTEPLQNGRLTEAPFKDHLVFVVSNPNHLSSIEMCYLFHDLHSLFSFSLGHEPSEENDTSIAIELDTN